MDFDIKMAGDGDTARQAYRTRVPGFEARFAQKPQPYPVKDISASGFAVDDPTKNFKEGQILDLEFLLNKKLFLGGLKAKVVRVVPNGIIGFLFEDMDRRQMMKLDKLVLEVQKRLIALRKAKSQE
ncbi:MAG: PilZ domain-containing protein [Desulfovibrionaceae bacterium]